VSITLASWRKLGLVATDGLKSMLTAYTHVPMRNGYLSKEVGHRMTFTWDCWKWRFCHYLLHCPLVRSRNIVRSKYSLVAYHLPNCCIILTMLPWWMRRRSLTPAP